MESRNFGIREKIIASFLILVIIFGLDGIYNLVTINNSQKLLWGILNEKYPSIKSLNQFCGNINKLTNTSSGIIYNNKSLESNSELVVANLLESKKNLMSNGLFWEAEEEKNLLKKIISDMDTLVLAFGSIKTMKASGSDSLAFNVYSNRLIPLSLSIIENSNVLIQTKEYEKETLKQKLSGSFGALKNGIFTLDVLIIIICIAISIYTSYTILFQIKRISKNMEALGQGVLPEPIENPGNDEVGNMAKAMNTLINGLKETTSFAKNIGKGDFEYVYTPLSNDDMLGNSLVNMRDNLKKVNEEDKLRNWTNEGYAQFSDLLRHNYNDRADLANDLIVALVKYVKANQGTFFVVNEINNEEILEEIATYAWDRKKFVEAHYRKGEGLAGQAWIEGDYIFLTDIPEDYVYIKSGIGKACPRCVIVVPLKYNDKIYGVIELASFTVFTDTEKNLILKIAESIAAILSNALNANKMKLLLEDTQAKEIMLREQEEEMRQNFEELEATQEDMKKKDKDKELIIKDLMSEIESLKNQLNKK
jgi:putative methionine-R-sulfoxide reductase with GAF domain/HAMP domain-containing protein